MVQECGLTKCTAHGLRKLAATLSAEAVATVNELMAMFGWSSPAQALVYTRAADKKRLAAEAESVAGVEGLSQPCSF